MGWSWGEEVDEEAEEVDDEAEEVDDEAEEVDDVVEEGDDGTRLGAWGGWGALALGRELRISKTIKAEGNSSSLITVFSRTNQYC